MIGASEYQLSAMADIACDAVRSSRLLGRRLSSEGRNVQSPLLLDVAP